MRQIFPTPFVCFALACSAPQSASHSLQHTDDRLDSCRDALKLEDADLRIVLTACSPMWKKPSCSAAWIEGLNMSGIAAAEHIVLTCKEAYCDTPDHAICIEDSAVNLTDREVDWLWLWTDLNTVILKEDLDGRVEAPEAGQFAKLLLTRMIFRDPSRDAP